MNNPKEVFEKIYENPGEVGWILERPPKEFIDIVESEKIKPCKVLEVGCGAGHFSILLSSKGFQVTGFDWSERAIKLAKQRNQESGASCYFLVIDFKDMDKLKEKFDFTFDWRFLHDIVDKTERKRYVELVSTHLKKGGKYLSVSFEGKGEVIKSPRKIIVYFASTEEMENLFKPDFKILEKKLIKITRMRGGERPANYFFMEKL